jgi:flagellar basal-body rod protein FlgG
MSRSLSIAATGMTAQQTNVEVIANNIANLNTTGFKRQRAEFQDLLYQVRGMAVGSQSSQEGTIVPTGILLGSGVRPAGVYRIHAQGSLIGTENALDLAVQGRGYFVLALPNGETGYTRSGSLQLSPAGEIVTAAGFRVLPGFNVPGNARQININAQGLVQVTVDGQVAPVDLGRLQLATFPNDAGLQALGGNIYRETAASGAAVAGLAGEPGFGTIQQGFLEASNVDIVSELTTLITAQRAYEMNSKVIQASDEMLKTMNQIR